MKRKFEPIKPKVNLTNQCNRCGKFYKDNDVVILKGGPVCLNCLDAKNPQDVNKMLEAGLQQEDILTICDIQYKLKAGKTIKL